VKKTWKSLMLFLLLSIAFGSANTAFAAPYEGYNYSFWSETKPAPLPYLPARQVDGVQLNIGSFNAPEDIFVTKDNFVYVVDTGNNRIVCLDSKFNVVRTIDKFNNEGKEDKLNGPQGMYIDKNNQMYITDTGNKRIVVLKPDGTFIRAIGEPKSDTLRKNFNYVPSKIVVDTAGRIYVVGKGVFDGIMEFDSGGNFTGFIGVNKVKISPIDLFWKRISTEAQKEQMELTVPVEFSNLDIDADGFIYATVSEEFSLDPIRRLNPSGADVLKREGYFPPIGDIRFTFAGTRRGPSMIISVAVDQHGMYSILDSKRGRIFTYDRDGKLLYQFGHLGEQVGNFNNPTEIDMLGDKMVVLDKGLNLIVVFKPTRYGETIRTAVIESDLGDEQKATAAWFEAKSLNNNLEIAYLGVGKAELRNGDNVAAMADFERGMHRDYYSRAFERYRKDFMWNHFTTISIVALAVVIAGYLVLRFARARGGEPGAIRTAWGTIFHPFNGFWDVKYEKKGKVSLALLILVILCILYILKQQLSGFIFNPSVNLEVNSLDEVKFIFLPFLLWCIANWSLTTLMDGEGKFKEIVIATAYALIPLVLVQIPLIVLSNIFTIQEASFYSLIESIAFIWVGWLIFVGMQTVHQYSVSKTIVTMLLTMVVIGIFLFLGLLFFSLLQQMISFGATIYKEIIFRIGEG